MISPAASNSNVSHITEENVRATLDSLVLVSASPPASPLRGLLLVEQFLARSGLPDTRYIRDFALAQILIEIITNELSRHRLMMGMPPPSESTPEAVQAAIRIDIKCGDLQLIDWSWLYYHYVRTDMNLSLARLAFIAHVDERTVRRYRQRGIRRLTYRLIEQEMKIRREYRRQRLYTALPTIPPPHLFGRRQSLQQVAEFLKGLPPHHIQVVGPAGIGKTAFVQETLRSLIDDDRLDDLIWIDTPRTTAQIRKQLNDCQISSDSQRVLSECMSSKSVAVVLDNADYLLYTLKPLAALLAELANAVVFLTARGPLPLGYQSKCLQLAELDQPDAWALIRSVLHLYYVEQAPVVTDAEIAAVWERAGGNPRKILHEVFKQQYPSPTIPRRCVLRSS